MESLFAILLMAAIAMTASCYHVDIERRDVNPYLALPISSDTVNNLIGQSRKIHKNKADPNGFRKYAANMLQTYTNAGYNLVIFRGTINIGDDCVSSGTTKKLVQTVYSYKDVNWRVVIFPSPCHLQLLLDPCGTCKDDITLQTRNPALIPCTNVPSTDTPNAYNLIHCTADLPILPSDLSEQVRQSHKLGSSSAHKGDFITYAGNMLSPYLSRGYNWAITRVQYVASSSCPGMAFSHHIDPGKDKQIVEVLYRYKDVDWMVIIFPNDCAISFTPEDNLRHLNYGPTAPRYCHDCGEPWAYHDKENPTYKCKKDSYPEVTGKLHGEEFRNPPYDTLNCSDTAPPR